MKDGIQKQRDSTFYTTRNINLYNYNQDPNNFDVINTLMSNVNNNLMPNVNNIYTNNNFDNINYTSLNTIKPTINKKKMSFFKM